jgi:hypothetical protein
VIFGEHPGLSASELVGAYNAGRKTEAEGDEEAGEDARRSFLVVLREEIAAYQKLQALYREGAIAIPEATRDAGLLLDEKDLTNMLRQDKDAGLGIPVEAGTVGGMAAGQTGRRGSVGGCGRRPGRPPSLAGLNL